jgi:hypothetical protein
MCLASADVAAYLPSGRMRKESRRAKTFKRHSAVNGDLIRCGEMCPEYPESTPKYVQWTGKSLNALLLQQKRRKTSRKRCHLACKPRSLECVPYGEAQKWCQGEIRSCEGDMHTDCWIRNEETDLIDKHSAGWRGFGGVD